MGFPKRLVLASALMVLAATTSAGAAGRIITPMLLIGINDQLVCIGTNVSAKPITMTLRFVGNFTDVTKTCTVSPASRIGCRLFVRNQQGYCRISVSTMTTGEVQTNVRGVLFTQDLETLAIGAAVPAQ